MPVNPNVLDPNKWVKPREKEKKQEPWLSRVTVTTDSGKQYDLDSQELNWIKNRYAQDNANSYGYDTADQQAKAAGQLSAKTLRSYTKSAVDQQLAQMGLPSEKNLDKYRGEFQQWHTGGIKDVFGNSVSSQDWTNLGKIYQQGWQYSDSAEDQLRKKNGQMPVALEKNYTDTEIDDRLKAAGLPSYKDFNTYWGQYGNQQAINALYANAAGRYTQMRTRQDANTGAFVQNDNNRYTLVVDPETGRTETKTGRDWYAQMFYDELGRTNEDGSYVYDSIMPLLKPSKTGEEEYIDPSKSYIGQMDDKFKSKAKEDKAQFDGHSAFSYDDFVNHYGDYYDKYWKDVKMMNGQTVDQFFAVKARDENEQATRDFYDVNQYKPEEVSAFIKEYKADYPDRTYGQMFADCFAHGMDEDTVSTIADTLAKQAKRNNAKDGVSGYNDIKRQYAEALQGAIDARNADAKAHSFSAATPTAENTEMPAAVMRAEAIDAKNPSTYVENRAQVKNEQKLADVRAAIDMYYTELAHNDRSALYDATQALRGLGFKNLEEAEAWIAKGGDIVNVEPKFESWENQITTGIEAADKIIDLMRDGGWTQENANKAVDTLRRMNVPEQVVQRGLEELDERGYEHLFTNEEAISSQADIRGFIKDFAESHGVDVPDKWTVDNASELLSELVKRGAAESDVKAVMDSDGMYALENFANSFYSNERMLSDSELTKERLGSMHEYIDAKKEKNGNNTAIIEQTKKAIERLLYDEEGNNLVLTSADSVLKAIDQVRQMPFTNPTAVDLALKDLGFSSLGIMSGVADALTAGWSTDELVKLRLGLGEERAVDVAPEDQIPDDAKFVRDTFGLSDFWMGNPISSSQKILRQDDFNYALDWAQQEIAAGRLTEYEAYDILAADGFHDEMEEYMPEDWHRAHFMEKIAPQLWAQSEDGATIPWEEVSEEGRAGLWDALKDEQKNALYGNRNWWKYDKSVKRTSGQAWAQQAAAILPGLITQFAASPITILDSVDAALTGRPEMWDVTQKLAGVQQALSDYGSVDEFSLGTRSAEWVTTAAQELFKMQILGSIGGMVGEAFSGTGVGSKILKATASNSKIVSKLADMTMGAIKASPFVAESYAGHYREAKMRGATNGEAAFYGALGGLTEGFIEGANVDKVWGQVIGANNIAEKLLRGGVEYLKMGINGQALLSSLALGFLGEGTEELVGYTVDTAMKMGLYNGTGLGKKLGLTPWAEGTEWSWKDAGEEALVGGLLGALGAGLNGGSLTTERIITEYAMHNADAFAKVFPDVAMSIGITENMPESVRTMYEKGGAHIMSTAEYDGTMTAVKSCLDGARNRIKAFQETQASEDKKLNDRLVELNGYAAKASSVDVKNADSVKEFMNLCADKLGIRIDLNKEILPQAKAAFKERINDAVKAHDTAIEAARVSTETALQNSELELQSLQKKMQEHWAGIYYANYDNIISGLTDDMVSNIMKAYMNGENVTPESRAQQAEARAKTEEARRAVEAETEAKAEAEAGNVTPESIYEAAYNRVYNDKDAGKAYANAAGNVEGTTAVERAESARKNFQAKTKTRFRRVTLELAGFEAKDGMSAKEIIAEAKKAMTPGAAQKLDMYMKLSKALGLNMVIRDVVPGTSGYVMDGNLYVTLSGKQNLLRVASHELTHYMQWYASDSYNSLRNHLISEVGGQEEFDKKLSEKAQEYGYDLNTDDGKAASDDELCAELCEKMLESKDALERFVSKDMQAAKTLKARLGKTLVAIKSVIRSMGTSDAETKADLIKEQETVEAWYTALSSAIDAANSKGKTAKAEAISTETAATTAVTESNPEANEALYMGEEDARREQLKSDLEKLAEKGTKVKDMKYAEVNELLDSVVLGDEQNYDKADYARVRGMLAQLIPDIVAYTNGDENVDMDQLNEKLNAAVDYMLGRYYEANSDELTALREAIPNKISLTETAYKDLREAKEMTLREASRELSRALGKPVTLVYKRSPDYNNAEHLDTLWGKMENGLANGKPSFAEDVTALIDLVTDAREAGRTTFDDLYGSQREDMVNTQVSEFLDAVQSMVEGKATETAALHSIDDDYMPLAERYDAGMATEEDMAEMQRAVDEAAEAAMPNSVARGKDGELMKFFHGTKAEFTKFERSKIGSTGRFEGSGFNFTPYEGRAQSYGGRVLEGYLNIQRPLSADKKTFSVAKLAQLIRNIDPTGDNIIANYARNTNDYGTPSFIRRESLTTARALSEYNESDVDVYSDLSSADPDAEILIRAFSDMGYDGLIHYDSNGNIKTAVTFSSEQFKLANPVTYDDDGNIIPLSERFNPNETDIRNMLDDDWDALIQQYGAKPQGREPRASDIRVPNRVNDKTRVSDFGKSLMESKHMTNDMREEGKRLMLEQNWMSYEPKSDDKSMTEARSWIAARQPAQAQQEFHDMVMQGKFGSKTNAIGLQLLAEASERGDVDSFFSIATDLQMATTDAGRAVQILNVLKELKGVGSAYYMQRYVERLNNQYDDQIQSGKMQPITVPQELMDQLARAKTVDEINAAEDAVGKEIARQLPLTWKARLNNWRHLSMLGSPLTQFRNLAGNLTMMGKNAAKDIVAPAVQRVAEWAGRASEGDRTHAWLTPADKSYWEPFAEQSYKEQQRHLSGTDKFGVKSSTNQYMRMFDTKWLNALAKGSENGKNVLTKNGILGMLNVVDDMFIKPQYKAALKQYMKAQGYTLNAEGEAGKVNSKGEWMAMTKGEKAEAEEWATQQAWKATFHDASDLADTLNKLSNKGPGWNVFIEGVMPYKKTPINIAKRGFEYSPAGIVMGTVQLLTSVKNGKMSAAQAIDNIASGITGTALMTVGMFLAKAGLIRAGGEDKKKYETYLEDTGDQKFALKFGDYSIDLSALSPASIPLFMGVALQEGIENGDWSNLELSDIADVFAGALNPFMEMSFMSSLNSALQNYSNGGIAGAVGGTVKTIAQNYVSQYLPTLGSKVAQFLDPTRRSTKSSAASPLGGSMDYYVRSLMKKVPGVASTLQPDVDVWGRTDTKDSFGDWALDFANKFILPTQVRVSNRDAVDNELIRLVENTGSTDFLPSDGNKYFKRGDKTYNMTAKQYAEYSQDRGQASYAALKEVMQSAVYKSASDDEKAAMLEKALKAAQTQVNTKWKEILGVFDD